MSLSFLFSLFMAQPLPKSHSTLSFLETFFATSFIPWSILCFNLNSIFSSPFAPFVVPFVMIWKRCERGEREGEREEKRKGNPESDQGEISFVVSAFISFPRNAFLFHETHRTISKVLVKNKNEKKMLREREEGVEKKIWRKCINIALLFLP